MDNDLAKLRMKKLEVFWIPKLRALYPCGLNVDLEFSKKHLYFISAFLKDSYFLIAQTTIKYNVWRV